jgi:hypothetical protein
MPAYRTLGRDRTLTLVYNSATVKPQPSIAIAVNPGGVTPTSVKVELFAQTAPDVSETLVATATYAGWSGQARQVVMTYASPETTPTGVYSYTLNVINIFPAGPSAPATIKDSLIVVNRTQSRFGRGWALAGIESIKAFGPGPLANQRLLWVAGDGSARIYRPVAASSPSKWAAPRGAYQDTIVADGSDFIRQLRHGVEVRFDYLGRHKATKARTTQTTTFTWGGAGDSLLSVTVPPAVTGGSYSIAYANSKVDSIADPTGRGMKLTIYSFGLTGIRDPDLKMAAFNYTNGNLTARLNRLGFTTLFGYTTTPSGFRVTSASVPYKPADSVQAMALTTYEPWDLKGLGSLPTPVAVDTAAVYTKVIGPRAGVADDATFSVDSLWGAPTKAVNALSETTRYERTDALHPALVTRVVFQSGRVVRMTYNARGNLTLNEDLTSGLIYAGLQIGTPNKTTRYAYGSPNAVDSPDTLFITPTRLAVYTYNTLGLTATVTDPRSHKTTFSYEMSGTKAGTMTQVREHLVRTWNEQASAETTVDQVTTLESDTKGNPRRIVSPVNVATSYINNARGLPEQVINGLSVKTAVFYDAMNRDTLTIDYPTQLTTLPDGLPDPLLGCDNSAISCVKALQPGITGAPVERKTRVSHNALTSDTLFDPGLVRRTFKLDARGLTSEEGNEYAHTDTRFNKIWLYDEAGLLKSVQTRNQRWTTPLSKTTYSYDALGRETAATMPARSWCCGAVTVPADNISRLYGTLGLTETHTNRHGVINRWFNAAGSLRKLTWQEHGGLWIDEVEYTYDATGARASMRHNADMITYAYDTVTGDLLTQTVTFAADNQPRTFTFKWDELGRRKEVWYPIWSGTQQMKVTFAYDAHGTIRRQEARHPDLTTLNNALRFTQKQTVVNALGQIVTQQVDCPTPPLQGNPCAVPSTTNTYSVQGWIVSGLAPISWTPGLGG